MGKGKKKTSRKLDIHPKSYTGPNDMFSFALGQKVRCLVTGFEGVTTIRTQHLNGCIQYVVKPPVDKEGKMSDGNWIDEAQLEAVDEEPIEVETSQRGHNYAKVPSTTHKA